MRPRNQAARRRQLANAGRRVLLERGAEEVRPLFPGSGDPELGALYVVETDGARRDRLLRLLDRCDVVEFAEPEARRKLARSA